MDTKAMDLSKRLENLSSGVAALVKKANSCHNKSDGKFCSTGGGSKGGTPLPPSVANLRSIAATAGLGQRHIDKFGKDNIKDVVRADAKLNQIGFSRKRMTGGDNDGASVHYEAKSGAYIKLIRPYKSTDNQPTYALWTSKMKHHEDPIQGKLKDLLTADGNTINR